MATMRHYYCDTHGKGKGSHEVRRHFTSGSFAKKDDAALAAAVGNMEMPEGVVSLHHFSSSITLTETNRCLHLGSHPELLKRLIPDDPMVMLQTHINSEGNVVAVPRTFGTGDCGIGYTLVGVYFTDVHANGPVCVRAGMTTDVDAGDGTAGFVYAQNSHSYSLKDATDSPVSALFGPKTKSKDVFVLVGHHFYTAPHPLMGMFAAALAKTRMHVDEFSQDPGDFYKSAIMKDAKNCNLVPLNGPVHKWLEHNEPDGLVDIQIVDHDDAKFLIVNQDAIARAVKGLETLLAEHQVPKCGHDLNNVLIDAFSANGEGSPFVLTATIGFVVASVPCAPEGCALPAHAGLTAVEAASTAVLATLEGAGTVVGAAAIAPVNLASIAIGGSKAV